ncbi:hypothetical protein ABFS82_03G118000 [Erythranthe guttata]|nr:PREDICTED: uncharacterized protein LOC105974361 [Erythranthe guttata]|eukprot:XP_012854900.1 PREDICTED: uncharacterized protein LOC105974361 [Erythranthe guttata]
MITIIPTKPLAFKSPSVITPLYITSNPQSSFSPFPFPFLTSPRLKFSHRRRRSFQVQASSLVLPLLPFPIDQVLVPSEGKTLHLYEARYIALLEESLFQKNKLFVHFVLDPIGITGSSGEASFAARFGCLVIIEKVERLDIGALVEIRGVGRVKILELKQGQPYLTGEVAPLQDNVLHKMTEISSKISELKQALHSLTILEIKLKTPGEALLQTQTVSSLNWAEKQLPLESITDFIPPVAERVSFVALQPISGATLSELAKLQREKLAAMDIRDTIERLDKSIELTKHNISMSAAKLAIQSLDKR